MGIGDKINTIMHTRGSDEPTEIDNAASDTVNEDQILPAGHLDDKRDIEMWNAHANDIAPPKTAQHGVRKIEAITLTWSKTSVYLALCFIWLLTLVNGFRNSVVLVLSPYATSSFASHSLLTVITVVSSAITSATFIPLAKLIDIWGRAESFALMVVFCVVGLIMMAASKNIATYSAAQVFYSIGFGGISFSWDVLATDVTSLRNRGLAFAFTSSPGLITAFAGSKVAQDFYDNVNWRWGIGCWAIVLPMVATPLYLLLAYNFRKARKSGVITKDPAQSRTAFQWIKFAVIEFDIPGVILLAGGFVTFLLPFTLAATAPHGWKSGYIIAMIITGFVVLVLFFLYEIFLAPVPFLRNRFLLDRTVAGACLLDLTYQISYYCYASYFTSFLQVVYDLDVAMAGYVANVFSVVSFVFLFFVGWLIRRTGRFKWILWICVPLYLLGVGLMIHFRQPNGYIGYIVMCEIFFTLAGSVFILCVQLAVLTTVDHQHVSAVLAFLYVSGSIGDAVGSAVSGVIWTNTFLPSLKRELPASAQGEVFNIYESLVVQLSYAVGSEERLAIQKAYGYAQTRMLAASTAIMVLAFIWVAMMKDYNVKKMSQTKGNVF